VERFAEPRRARGSRSGGLGLEQLHGALAVMDRVAEGVARVAREDGAPLPEGGGLREEARP